MSMHAEDIGNEAWSVGLGQPEALPRLLSYRLFAHAAWCHHPSSMLVFVSHRSQSYQLGRQNNVRALGTVLDSLKEDYLMNQSELLDGRSEQEQ